MTGTIGLGPAGDASIADSECGNWSWPWLEVFRGVFRTVVGGLGARSGSGRGIGSFGVAIVCRSMVLLALRFVVGGDV